jgi:predicted transcriptional regulator
MTTTEIQLPKVTQTRISRLAHASGRSPAAMLRFVLRDGFDAVELSIKENAQADAEFAAGATARHTDVMRDALTAVRQAKREALAAA